MQPKNHPLSELVRCVLFSSYVAGRGPLVRASLAAAAATGRQLRVYAVEKNPSAVVHIQAMVVSQGWEDLVTIVGQDMRLWEPPEKVCTRCVHWALGVREHLMGHESWDLPEGRDEVGGGGEGYVLVRISSGWWYLRDGRRLSQLEGHDMRLWTTYPSPLPLGTLC
jgi:hypothetical protein